MIDLCRREQQLMIDLPSVFYSPYVAEFGNAAISYLLDYLAGYDYYDYFQVTKYNNWSLSRISHRQPKLVSGDYVYPKKAGSGATVVILDHWVSEQTLKDDYAYIRAYDYTGTGFDDKYDRGTQAALTIGHESFGVAPDARIVMLKVGYLNIPSDQLRINVINAISNTTYRMSDTRSVVIHLGLSFDMLKLSDRMQIEQLLDELYHQGIPVIKSAGSGNIDACDVPISNVSSVVTVGSIAPDNKMVYINASEASNYGSCVDVLAPGSHLSTSQISRGFGTTLSAAFVTGIAALYISMGVPSGDVAQTIIDSATLGIAEVHHNTPNRIAFNLPTSHRIWPSLISRHMRFMWTQGPNY